MIYKYLVEWKRSPGMGSPAYKGKMELATLFPGEEGREHIRRKARSKLAESLIVPTTLTLTPIG